MGFIGLEGWWVVRLGPKIEVLEGDCQEGLRPANGHALHIPD